MYIYICIYICGCDTFCVRKRTICISINNVFQFFVSASTLHMSHHNTDQVVHPLDVSFKLFNPSNFFKFAGGPKPLVSRSPTFKKKNTLDPN